MVAKRINILSQNKRNIFAQGGRYLIVGFSSAFIELILFWILRELFAIPVQFSNPCAVAIATIYNFILSRKWTFKATSSLARSIVLFLLLFIWNQVFSTCAILFMESLGLYSLLAKLITMACIVLWNFVLYRKVVFK